MKTILVKQTFEQQAHKPNQQLNIDIHLLNLPLSFKFLYSKFIIQLSSSEKLIIPSGKGDIQSFGYKSVENLTYR